MGFGYQLDPRQIDTSFPKQELKALISLIAKHLMATHSSKDTLDRFDSQKAVQNVAIATRMAEKLDETILKNAD